MSETAQRKKGGGRKTDLHVRLQTIPGLDTLLEAPGIAALLERHPRPVVLHAARNALEFIRESIKTRALPAFDQREFCEEVALQVAAMARPGYRRVINATGVVIHTNLGRAPLPDAAIEALREVSRYCNLEYDFLHGARGSRFGLVDALLRELTGAEAAGVANNNAAAVMLALNTLANNAEVILSRGEMVEIGGSFRMPDVIARSGARLVEIGTTNKTRLSDYENAITPDTRVILKVHPSNYRIVGFTGAPERRELAALAQRHNLVFVEDLGSGALVDLRQYGLPYEPTAREAIEEGADVVLFSGDKLLGGPQAGIFAGKQHPVEQMKRNPLMRALRVDKLSIAALEATLRLYRDPGNLAETIPVLRMLAASVETLRERAERMIEALADSAGLEIEIARNVAYAGGGALPHDGVETIVARIRHDGLDSNGVSQRMRRSDPPVIGRIEDGAFLLDMRTIAEDEIPDVVRALRSLKTDEMIQTAAEDTAAFRFGA